MSFYINFSSFTQFQNKKKISKYFLKKTKEYLKKKKIDRIEFSVPKIENIKDYFIYNFNDFDKILNFDNIKNNDDFDKILEYCKDFKSKKVRVKFSNKLEFKIDNEKIYKKKIDNFIELINKRINDFKKNNVYLVLENHQDLDSDHLSYILKNIDSKFFGLCFDLGNSLSTLETPTYFIKKFKNRIYHCHLKNYKTYINNNKLNLSPIDLGSGSIDIIEMFYLLKKYNSKISFSIEVGNFKKRIIDMNNKNILKRFNSRSNIRIQQFSNFINENNFKLDKKIYKSMKYLDKSINFINSKIC